MRGFYFTLLISVFLQTKPGYSQGTETDSAQYKSFTMKEALVSVNKTEESKKNIAQQVQILNAKELQNTQAQTTADLLSNSGNVFIQKSQLGGGSVNLRGFEANRNLLVIDGVRMNNLIYRSGHIQNIITSDPLSLERIEILFGPASTVYGSDALGGVVYLFTKNPLLAGSGQHSNIKANFLTRYGAVNQESTNHLDFNYGTKKIASYTSVTYSNFGDLKGGNNRNPFYNIAYGERPFYAERINGKDSLISNSNKNLQVHTAYTQIDLIQKVLVQQSETISHLLNVQYSASGNIPRYDRLTDPNGTGLKSAEWYYGPQKRLLTAYDLNIKKPHGRFQGIHLGINYQALEESRHNRNFGSNILNHRIEKVQVIGANLDFRKRIKNHELRFGFDGQFNTLKSTANTENILNSVSGKLDSRYPDGNNTMKNIALYFSHTCLFYPKLTWVDGFRVGFVSLHATFIDTSFFHLPFTRVSQNNPVFSGSLGLIYNPLDNLKISLLFSTGYRVPNTDDLSKVFESAPGAVMVPNSNLTPEETRNYELGITKIFNQNIRWENAFYYTQFVNAIITDKYRFNGQDSIFYEGSMSQVYASQNKREAYIYGFSSNIKSLIGKRIVLSLSMNYTFGRIKTDSVASPLDHIPPFMTKLSIGYLYKNLSSEVFLNYNGWKYLSDYYLNGEDNEQYATPKGMPAWYTANIRTSYQLNKIFTIQAGIENIFDTQYRTFASGINAPGRNVFATLRFHY